jgi:hypothetical protein
MAIDIHAEVLGWVLDEIDHKSLGEEFGGAVAWSAVQVGNQVVPIWYVMLTARNPIATEGPLHHTGILGAARPQEKTVRDEVIKGMRQLRELTATKLAPANGNARALAGGRR